MAELLATWRRLAGILCAVATQRQLAVLKNGSVSECLSLAKFASILLLFFASILHVFGIFHLYCIYAAFSLLISLVGTLRVSCMYFACTAHGVYCMHVA